MAKAHASRNKSLSGAISKYSRSAIYRKRALYKRKKTGVKRQVKEEPKTQVKPIGGEKNGEKREVPIKRESRYYPTEDRPRKLKSRKNPKPAKLRSSITPGTVLVLLAGRHRGKRVIFLKQLQSGLLLVTAPEPASALVSTSIDMGNSIEIQEDDGPYKVNGVPLRRVPQSYVIATKTKVDLSKLKTPDNLSDDFFRRQKKQKRRSEEMFEQSQEAYQVSDERKESQQAVDESIMEEISKVPNLRKYLRSLFTLRKGQYPHQMIF